MKYWATLACAWLGVGLALPVHAEDEPAQKPASKVVVDIRTDRILLLDITQVGSRLIAVGERGFTMVSDDGGQSWKGVQTPVSRTLTGVAFRDDKVGVAVGHGGSVVRTEDGGSTWTHVNLDEAGPDSVLGVTYLGGEHFVLYGAFGLYFVSQDAGRTWQRATVLGEDFDRHISQIIQAGNSLVLVAESGTLARSDDGGATWIALTSPYPGSYFGALAPGDGSVLAFGMRGNIFRSTDLGATWQKVELGTTASLMSGRKLADGRILLVGNSGLLALSKDNGLTFETHFAKTGKGFAAAIETGGKIILAGDAGITPLDPAWLSGQ